MIKEHQRLVTYALFLSDITITVTSFFLAYWIRSSLLPAYSPLFSEIYELGSYYWLLLIIVPLWVLLLLNYKVYKSYRVESITGELKVMAKVVFSGGVIIGAVAYLIGEHYLSRSLVAVFVATNAGLLCTSRIILRMLSRYVRGKGYNYLNVIIAGTDESAIGFLGTLERNKEWGLNVIGFLTVGDAPRQSELCGYKVLGRVSDIEDVIKSEVVDEVIFASPGKDLSDLEETILVLEDYGINTRMALDIFPHSVARLRVDEVESIPLLTFTTLPPNTTALAVKRFLDVSISAVLLILAAPLMLVVAILIKSTSRGPVLFRQKRCGKNGRTFTIYKFRSMVLGAEERVDELRDLNDMDGPVFMIKKDPRVTILGSFIRKMSIDELPQLWNVLKGDMSLIGPRPPLPDEVAAYKRWQRRRLSMKPGLVCLWQVSGNYVVDDFDEWVKMDLHYIDKWSLGLDVKIFLKTIPVVIFGRGAS